MTTHTFTMNQDQAQMIHELAKEHIAALHNYIATRIEIGQAQMIHELAKEHIAALHNDIATSLEIGDVDKATALTKELREYQALFAGFNMKAKALIAESRGAQIETKTTLRSI